MTPSKDFPKKLFYRVHEVAAIVGVEPYVLRYWETRFSMLRPERFANDERRYRHGEVLLVMRIKHLLHKEGFTIAGAADRIRRDPTGALDAEFDGRIPKSIAPPAPGQQLDLLAPADHDPTASLALALERLRELRKELSQLLSEQGDGPAA